MRFVFASTGSFGDVAPLLALALGLKGRGHEVTFVINPYHRPLMERWGVDMIPVGDADWMRAQLQDKRLAHMATCGDWILDANTGETRQHVDILEATLDDKTVLVGRLGMYGTRMVEEKLGIPNCCIGVTPVEVGGVDDRPLIHGPIMNTISKNLPAFMYNPLYNKLVDHFFDRHLRARLDVIRKDVGLGPMTEPAREWPLTGRKPLLLYPDWYGKNGSHLPDQVGQSGFLFLPDEDVETDPVVENFLQAGDPPVATSLGSAVCHDDGLLGKIKQACESLGERELVLSFQHKGSPVIEGDRCITGPVVMTKILPRCKALVHRGGVGAAAAGMRSGIPQLVVAHSIDHPDTGERISRLGVGKWLFGYIMNKRWLRNSLNEVANNPKFSQTAKEVSKRFDTERWLTESMNHVESLMN